MPRDLKIDFWRGLCILGMVSWHATTSSSIPPYFSMPIIQPFNFVAEGFVILAGVSIGLRLSSRNPSFVSTLVYFQRALEILLIHYVLVGVILVLTRTTHYFGPPPSESLWDTIVAVLTLQEQPYLGDVLSLFVFLFASVPLCYLLLRAAGGIGLMAVSLAVYLASIFAPDTGILNANGGFNFNTWQFYFAIGMLFGRHYSAVIQFLGKHSGVGLLLTTMVFAGFMAIRLALRTRPDFAEQVPAYLQDSRLPTTIFRTTYILTHMLLVCLLTIRYWDYLASLALVRWISEFGKRSMFMFVASVVLDYLTKVVFIVYLQWTFPATLLVLLVQLVILAILLQYLQLRKKSPPPKAMLAV